MSVSEVMLIAIILALSIAGFMTYRKYSAQKSLNRDTHIENIALEIKIKKKEIRDEVNTADIDALIDESNGSKHKNN